jgi:hypothetical protein
VNKALSIAGFVGCAILARQLHRRLKTMSRPLRISEVPCEQLRVMLVDEEELACAEGLLAGCEGCTEGAHLPLDYLLDALTSADPLTTEYLLPRPLRCPRCRSEVTEKTAVRLD